MANLISGQGVLLGIMTGKRVLVAYATRYGSTAETAGVVAEELRKQGLDATAENVLAIKMVKGFDAVVLGSPVYMGKWLVDIVEFVKTFRVDLSAIPLAAFTAGLTVCSEGGDGGDGGKAAGEAVEAVRMYVDPVETGLFGGKMEKKGLSFADRAIITMVRAKEGDCRDWDAIRSWSKTLPAKLGLEG